MSKDTHHTAPLDLPPVDAYKLDMLMDETIDDSPQFGILPSSDQRRRGEHSTKCLCPSPFWSRSEDFKRLPGQLGKAYNRLVKTDKAGKPSLRIRYSNNPIFVLLRYVVGRKNKMRSEKRELIDALIILLVAYFDLTNFVCLLNLSQIAYHLSKKDANGNVIERVTVTRVSRLIDELAKFGLVYPSEDTQWDKEGRQYYPKHVYLTDLFWQTLKICPEKLAREGEQRRQAEYEGICMPGEIISVSRARAQWNQNLRARTLKLRRQKAAENKVNKRLKALPFDERLNHIAEYYRRKKPVHSLHQLTLTEFEQHCYSEINRRGLSFSSSGSDDPPAH